MYGLDSEDSLGFLIDTKLVQLCIGENEVILKFDDVISITIESHYLVSSLDQARVLFKNTVDSASRLAEYLGKKIVDISIIDHGTLRLIFEDGRLLEIYDTFKDYESYQIQYREKLIIV